MKKGKSLLLLAGVAVIASGCASNEPKPVKPPHVQNDPAIQSIQKAVDEIKSYQHQLAAVERSNKPAPRKVVIPALPEFVTPVYMAGWTGPVDEALSSIAEIIGYRFDKSGNFGIAPIIHLDAKGDPVSKVLIAIADQGEGVYDIRIDSVQRTLTLVKK